LNYLIRDPQTCRFLHGGEWMADSRRADRFAEMGEAIAACRRFKLRRVELVLEFGLDAGRTHQLQLALPEDLLRWGQDSGTAGSLGSGWQQTTV